MGTFPFRYFLSVVWTHPKPPPCNSVPTRSSAMLLGTKMQYCTACWSLYNFTNFRSARCVVKTERTIVEYEAELTSEPPFSPSPFSWVTSLYVLYHTSELLAVMHYMCANWYCENYYYTRTMSVCKWVFYFNYFNIVCARACMDAYVRAFFFSFFVGECACVWINRFALCRSLFLFSYFLCFTVYVSRT